MKHATLGNEYVSEGEQSKREKEGWVKWPRTKEQKGIVSHETKSRKELEAGAEALEIKVDGRWSDKRLAEEIKKVETELSR